jgi:hypothetical protein
LVPLVEPVDMTRTDDLVSRNIWEKMWRGWLRMSQKYLHDCEWFMKTGTQTRSFLGCFSGFLSFLIFM